MGTMDIVIGKEKLLEGLSNFKVWSWDVVQNVFEKKNLWDLLDPEDSDEDKLDSSGVRRQCSDTHRTWEKAAM